ncbi:hypothetical protein [Bacillus sp. NPDC094106]
MFARINDYFGLNTLSDCTWYYGVFIIGTLLYLIIIFITYIL